jgi:glycosyltransferase involved in cell wall biosynthesis
MMRKNGIRIVATIHDLLPFDEKFYDFHFYKRIYTHADLIINQARSNTDVLVNKFRVDRNKIVYIPHGHYMEYAEIISKEESRKKLNLPKKQPIILFFGQIKKVKGLDVLIRAMKRVTEVYPDALCLIAGNVWKDDFSIYQEMINELDISENVRADIRFIDDSEIKYYFNASDIVALPYLRSYQSGVVLLAYAYQKPVVATRTGEFLNVVKDKETGLLVDVGDSKAFADALIWYLAHQDKGKEFAINGKADVEVRLSWDTIGKKVVDEYQKIIN